MRVPLKWLEELVRIDVPVEKLVEMLDLSGTKVEDVLKPGQSVEGVVVAEVIDIADHPNADNLTLVEVKTGDGEDHRVVCGVRNFEVGDRVPLAVVGAKLAGGEITERKIRGELSRGMLCSALELGVSKDHSGILVLPPDVPLGADVSPLLGLDDTVLELEITPNRPDCMSVLGVAREVGALLGNDVTRPETEATGVDVDGGVKVTIEDPQGCPRYVARYIEDVRVGPSPVWLAARLIRAGIRPISNLVDITNYVMLELGHPLHAFDAEKIHERHIVVRRARKGEKLLTLDGIERSLDERDVMIADPKHSIAIGGVMGGEDSEISDSTTAVILEAAYFDPASISFTSRRHSLRTEASARFQRGMDPEAPPVAAARAARLMSEIAGSKISKVVVDEYPNEIPRRKVELRTQRVGHLLGAEVAPDRQVKMLRAIDLEVEQRDGVLEVEIPGFRPDLKREVDLIEEVARLVGFDILPATLPPGRVGELDTAQRLERSVRRALTGFGVHEAWTPSLGSRAQVARLGLPEDHPAWRMVRLSNAMGEDQEVLRTTILPGLLSAAARNVAHRASGVALFEIASVYEPTDRDLPDQPLVLAAVFAGSRRRKEWHTEETRWDFFAAKGVLQALFASIGVDAPTVAPVAGMPFHPTRSARIEISGKPAGVIGEVHPDVCARFKVPEGTVAFEMGFAPLVAQIPPRVQVAELPRFPAVYLDVAVVVDEDVAAGRVEELIRDAGSPELSSVRLFDIYGGDQIASGKKSLAFGLELRDPERTMTEGEALAVRDRIVGILAERVSAELRG